MGSGTTLDRKKYQFVHKKPEPGINYYRLKQVDFDGGFERSKVISINMDYDEIVIQPNPTNGLVEIKGSNLSQAILKITDGMGRIIKLNELDDYQTVNLHNEPNGIYFFIIQTAHQTIVKRIVKG